MAVESTSPLINQAAKLATHAHFHFRDLYEANIIAEFLASACPNPRLAIIGIIELLVNAVEHGNLGISYAEKSKLQHESNWTSEVERRLSLPENVNKFVEVEFSRIKKPGSSKDSGNPGNAKTGEPENPGKEIEELHIRIKDQGEGFDWKSFEEMKQEKTIQHGRGLTIAKSIVFSRLEFLGRGNEVLGVISLD